MRYGAWHARRLMETPAATRAPDLPVVIVGTGPVGLQVAREVLRRAPAQPLVLFGAEPWEPYNRVQLSELLAGQIDWAEIANPLELSAAHPVAIRINTPVDAIDRITSEVVLRTGAREGYSRLVLATGSRVHRPAVRNLDVLGVYAYRDVNDAQVLMTN